MRLKKWKDRDLGTGSPKVAIWIQCHPCVEIYSPHSFCSFSPTSRTLHPFPFTSPIFFFINFPLFIFLYHYFYPKNGQEDSPTPQGILQLSKGGWTAGCCMRPVAWEITKKQSPFWVPRDDGGSSRISHKFETVGPPGWWRSPGAAPGRGRDGGGAAGRLPAAPGPRPQPPARTRSWDGNYDSRVWLSDKK